MTRQSAGRAFVKRAALSLAFAAVGMTLASLIGRHQLPSAAEVVAFLVVALVALGVVTLTGVAWRKVRNR
ncbi:hypothetical protein [Streptomyces aureus]|uniref:hypothetical protein n=1 Tax=Streptomyces aureus TaxID=193461 RepID=UPI0033DE5505